MLKWLKNLFRRDDPSAYNCEVYINLRNSELVVVNQKGNVEASYDVSGLPPQCHPEYEYLGQL